MLSLIVRRDGHVVVDNWIKKKGLKASFKVVKNIRKFWRIDIEGFWKWADVL